VTPATEAGVSEHVWDRDDVIALLRQDMIERWHTVVNRFRRHSVDIRLNSLSGLDLPDFRLGIHVCGLLLGGSLKLHRYPLTGKSWTS